MIELNGLNIEVEVIIKRITSSGQTLVYKNNKIILQEMMYHSEAFLEKVKDLEKDNKIGVLDIETYVDENNFEIPYSIGAKTMNKSIKHYYSPGVEPSIMILNFINNELLVKENHNYVFFAHNGAKFDSVILLDSLIKSSQ